MISKLKLLVAGATLGGLAALGAISSAQAAPMVFFGEDLHNNGSTRLTVTPNADAAAADFLSHLSGVGTEDFEGFAPGGVSSLSLSFPGSSGSITAELSNPSGSDIDVENETSGTNGVGRYPVSGDQYLGVDGGNFVITFSSGIAAFGFYGVDIGDFGGALSLTLANGVTEIIDIGNTLGSSASTDGSVLFFGVITESPFTQITFTNSETSDVFAFDNMTIGDLDQIVPPTGTIPEPASLALFGLGLAGLAAMGRRRKRTLG